jgi:hypothetical protein
VGSGEGERSGENEDEKAGGETSDHHVQRIG